MGVIRNSFLLVGVTAIVAGCMPTAAWYKGSVSQRRANDQFTTCQVKAVKDVPTSIESQITGGYYIGYIWIPTASDVDTNDGLRSKVVAQCMTRKGFQAVELPLCAGGVATPDMNARATINEGSCFKALPGGYYAIAQS